MSDSIKKALVALAVAVAAAAAEAAIDRVKK